MRTSCNFKLENEHSGFFAGPFVRDLRAEKATVDLKERGDANLQSCINVGIAIYFPKFTRQYPADKGKQKLSRF